jgi:hypothetical protein
MRCFNSLLGCGHSLFGFAGFPVPDAGKFLPSLWLDQKNPTKTGAKTRKFPNAANSAPSRRPIPTGSKRASLTFSTGMACRKARAAAVEAFYAIADREQWVLGEDA